MTTTVDTATATAVPTPCPQPDLPTGRARGIVAMLTGAASNQTGAAVAAHAFGAIGPIGVVAVRQLVAAAVLLTVARPPLRRLTRHQWWPVLALAAVFATMNLTLYSAIDRIGLGLAVTLEFLGPLTVALLAARGLREGLLAAIAAAGVYVLVLPGPSSDLLGIGLALIAAAAWAGYILINQVAGRRLPGLHAPATASLVSAIAYLPVIVWLGIDGRLWGWPLLLALIAGVMSSAVPYAADLTALRHLPAQFFGAFSSIQPVLAALAGVLILGQWLAGHEWLGIAIIVVTNVVATWRLRHQRVMTRGMGTDRPSHTKAGSPPHTQSESVPSASRTRSRPIQQADPNADPGG